MDVTIERAGAGDIERIFQLQYLAFQREAHVWDNDFFIQPLTESLEELRQEFQDGPVLKAVRQDGLLVGSVRGVVRDGTLHLHKLMVHPDFRGQGIGGALVLALEALHPGLRYELFTSCRSENNLRLYEKLGYRRYWEEPVTAEFSFIHLEKDGSAARS